jgi:hypothetical protein
MRNVTQTVYLYNELPTEEAKKKARDWWRKEDNFDYAIAEVRSAIKGFEKCFRCEVKRWEVAPYAHAWAAVKCDYSPLEEEGDTIEDFIKSRLPEKEFPFTGVYYDEDLLEPLRLLVKGETIKHEDLNDLLTQCVEGMLRSLRSEWEARLTDEAVAETIIANEYEFTEQGNHYC